MTPARYGHKEGSLAVLNAGIYTSDQSIFALLGDNLKPFFSMSLEEIEHQSASTFNHFIFNFPSNWIQLDVSREKIVSYSDWMKNQFSEREKQHICCEIAQALGEQVESYLHFVVENGSSMPAINLDEILGFISLLNPQAGIEDLADRYSLRVLLTEKGINYSLYYSPERKPVYMSCQSEEAKVHAFDIYEKLLPIMERNRLKWTGKIDKDKEQFLFDSDLNRLQKYYRKKHGVGLRRGIRDGSEQASLVRCTLTNLYSPGIALERRSVWEYCLKWGILSRISVEEAERGKEISITYEDVMFQEEFSDIL